MYSRRDAALETGRIPNGDTQKTYFSEGKREEEIRHMQKSGLLLNRLGFCWICE